MLYWIIGVLLACWFIWVFVVPSIAARITTSKWFAKATMPGLKDVPVAPPPAPYTGEMVTLPNGSTVPIDIARKLYPTLFESADG